MFPAVAPLSSAMTALASVLEMVTLVVAVLTTFQLASTALTTMLLVMAVPAAWEFGVPILPVPVPGVLVSPGNRSWSLATAPALTVMEGVVLALLLPSAA